MAKSLPLRLQSAVLNATNQFFEQSGIKPSPERCKTGIQQGVSIAIDKGSSLRALGNLESVQKAQMQFQCAPGLTDEQRAGLRNAIATAISVVLDNDLPTDARKPTVKQLQQLVQLTVDRRFDKCVQSAQRDVAVVPSTRFVGSVIEAGGCLDEEFEQIATDCQQEIENGEYQGPKCISMLECVKKDGNIILLSNNINLGGDCPQLSEISENVLAALRRLNDGQQTGFRTRGTTAENESPGLPVGWIIAIAVGSLLLLFVIVTVAVIASAKRRNNATRRMTFNPSQPNVLAGRNVAI